MKGGDNMINSIKVSEQDGLSWLLALKNNPIDSNRNRINYEKYKGSHPYTNRKVVYKNTIVPKTFLPH